MMSTARPKQVTRSVSYRRLFRSAACFLVVMAFGLAGATSSLAQEASNSLEDIQFRALPGNMVELTLVMSGDAPEPLTFTIDEPARIALDLADTRIALASRRKDVNMGVLDAVLAAESEGRTRVVLNLENLVAYETSVEGNTISVTLGSTAESVTSFAAAEETSAVPADSMTPAAPAPVAAARGIQDIDFRRTETGGGRVIITLADSGTPVDVAREGSNVVLNFDGAEIPDNLVKRLNVLDFATPVNTVDALRLRNGARVVITGTPPFDDLAYQTDRTFTVEIQPTVVEEPAMQAQGLFAEQKEYEGERLTLNFQDIEARAVLQLLADVSGKNIVVADTVQGNVTLRLRNVPWDQALDIVLATKGLDMRENGNVIIVAPADEIAARERAELESRKELEQLEPLRNEYLQVNYAKAGDLAALLQGTGASAGLLSERGSVTIDERTNTLLLRDTTGSIDAIRDLVTTLDIPIRQVLIEARIVVVSDDFSRDLGIRWGATAVRDHSDGLVSVTGTGEGSDVITQSAIQNLQDTGQPFPVSVPPLDDRYAVNLPVANPAGQLALAILDDDYLVELEISAVQAEGRGEVIASPRVITANQKEASIEQGVEIPYQEASSSGATSTQFKDAVLSLTVTPQITPDNRVIMDLFVTRDTVGEVVTTERGGEVPSIDTRKVNTQVLVNNGQTVVLGGIYETERGEFVTKVPILGDIPGLGYLFRSTRMVSNKAELLIFVTPKILEEGSSIY